MNDTPPPGRVDSINNGTMAVVTIMLIVTFCLLTGLKTIDSGVFSQAVILVLGYWFGRQTAPKNGNGADPAAVPPVTPIPAP